MNPQEFMQFIQEFPEVVPYLEADEGLMAEIILDPNFREEIKQQVYVMRGEEPPAPEQPAPMVTSDQYGRKTGEGFAPSTADGGWDFANNRKFYDEEALAIKGGEAGSKGYDSPVTRDWGTSEQTEYTWQPSYKVNSPSGMSYVVGEAQAKKMFEHMVNGGYARPEDFEKVVQPTGNTMKTYDLENTNKTYANNQKQYQWMNEQYAKDPEAEMQRRAEQWDDYYRGQDYKKTGAQTPVDTYGQRELDRLYADKQREEDNINAFIGANAGKVYPQQPKPQTYQYENFDASGKSMGFTTGTNGKSNYMQGAVSVKAPNGKSYNTGYQPPANNPATTVKSQPALNFKADFNNFKSGVRDTVYGKSSRDKDRDRSKNPAVVTARPATKPKPATTTTTKVTSGGTVNKNTGSSAGSRIASSIKDKLRESLRKGK